MRFIFTFFLTIWTIVNLSAQEISKEEWKKMSKSERKEYKAKMVAEQERILNDILTSKEWVLEAYQLQNRYGETANIEPTLNFIGVVGENASVQLGASGAVGINGVGGITVEGKITKYELKSPEKSGQGFYIRMEVSGASSGHISMSVQVNSDATSAATLSDNTGGRLTYRGKIVPLSQSTVYKGQVRY